MTAGIADQLMSRAGAFLCSGILLCAAVSTAQDLNWDPALRRLVVKGMQDQRGTRPEVMGGLDYNLTLTGFSQVNENQGKGRGQLSFLQDLKYKLKISVSRFQLSNELVHSLGFLYYIDSTGQFQPDENSLTTRLSIEISTPLSLTATTVLTSRIFNHKETFPDENGSLCSMVSSSFLTPLICTFSGGFGLQLAQKVRLDIGLSSAKLTFLLDTTVFGRLGRTVFCGVNRGRRNYLEYGLSLHFTADRTIARKLMWYCDLLLFKADGAQIDLSLRNIFAYRIGKFMKTSLQTRLMYDEDVSLKLRMENLLSVGFSFHL
jgi:hypothetical protein